MMMMKVASDAADRCHMLIDIRVHIDPTTTFVVVDIVVCIVADTVVMLLVVVVVCTMTDI
jgi:hypothetical protein